MFNKLLKSFHLESDMIGIVFLEHQLCNAEYVLEMEIWVES